jgi:hypothetical protein
VHAHAARGARQLEVEGRVGHDELHGGRRRVRPKEKCNCSPTARNEAANLFRLLSSRRDPFGRRPERFGWPFG